MGTNKNKMGNASEKPKESNLGGNTSSLKPEPKIKKSSPHWSIVKANTSKKDPIEEKKTEGKSNNNEKHTEKGKEKLGGLIFMCNAKTKLDCFRYKVMGFPESKRELVMNIRPGLKLFLYDYDARLLYGIYKASSPGGSRLEPAAFNGSFTAQVRFEVEQDCSPIPPTIFGDAIKGNFDTKKNMLFKNDLSIPDVGRLKDLFYRYSVQPIQTLVQGIPPLPVCHMPPMTLMPAGGICHVQQGIVGRAQHAQQILKEAPRKAASRVISEKDYRTYGLLRKAPVEASAPLSATSPHVPVLRQGTYYPHLYGASSSAPYAAAHPSLVDRVCEVRGTPGKMVYGSRLSVDKTRQDITERLSSTHSGSALAVYNRSLQHPSNNSDLASLPVSSRYSFAGPTRSYR